MPLLTDLNRRMNPMLRKMLLTGPKLCNKDQCNLHSMDCAVSFTRRNINGNTRQTFLQLKKTQKIGLVKTLLTWNQHILKPITLWQYMLYHTNHFIDNYYECVIPQPIPRGLCIHYHRWQRQSRAKKGRASYMVNWFYHCLLFKREFIFA
jgi:hypothetical protein